MQTFSTEDLIDTKFSVSYFMELMKLTDQSHEDYPDNCRYINELPFDILNAVSAEHIPLSALVERVAGKPDLSQGKCALFSLLKMTAFRKWRHFTAWVLSEVAKSITCSELKADYQHCINALQKRKYNRRTLLDTSARAMNLAYQKGFAESQKKGFTYLCLEKGCTLEISFITYAVGVLGEEFVEVYESKLKEMLNR